MLLCFILCGWEDILDGAQLHKPDKNGGGTLAMQHGTFNKIVSMCIKKMKTSITEKRRHLKFRKKIA